MVGRDLDNHETCGALRSNLRPVNSRCYGNEAVPLALGAAKRGSSPRPVSLSIWAWSRLLVRAFSSGFALCVASGSSRNQTRPIPTPPWTNRPARFRSDWVIGMPWLHSASGWGGLLKRSRSPHGKQAIPNEPSTYIKKNIADALKLLLKEYVSPTQANLALFFLRSYYYFNIFFIRLSSYTLWSGFSFMWFKFRYTLYVSCIFFSYIWYIISRMKC